MPRASARRSGRGCCRRRPRARSGARRPGRRPRRRPRRRAVRAARPPPPPAPSPASSAAAGSAAPSPRIASARASAAPAAGIRARRASTTVPTPCGPSAWTRAAAVAVGASSSAVSSRSSSLSSSGLPCVAARQARTNSAGRIGAERVREPPLDRGGAQGPRAQDLASRDRRRAAVSAAPALLVHGPRGDQQQHRQRLDAAGEEAEELQRRLVGPLRVVDAEHQRLVVREVRGQPVEAVQALVGRVVADGVAAAGAEGSNIAPASAAAPASQRARSSGVAW